MLAGLMALKGEVLATEGNLNNEIGAPLTLLRLAPEHRSAVIELGASAQGEIARTVAFTQPDVAVLNNAMGAHLEGFGGLDGVVRAKGEIFTGLREGGVGVVNLDSPHASVWIERLHRLKRRVFTFGVENGAADISAGRLQMNADGSWRFVLDDGTDQLPVNLQILGRHNVANATAAAAAWVAAGQPLTQIADAIKAATDLLAQLPGERILVLGDMAELGEDSPRLHAEVGRYAAERGIERLLVTGPKMQAAANAFASLRNGAEHFTEQLTLIERVKTLLAPETTLLVKGSRSAQMDRVVAALVEGEH
jgi:UDP-N-acetylmuramoyl-tripeptide--D-alanyl-D-alanine ligase